MLGRTSEGITPESLSNEKCSVEHLHCGLLAKMPDVDTVLVGINMYQKLEVWSSLIIWAGSEKLAFHSSSCDYCLLGM